MEKGREIVSLWNGVARLARFPISLLVDACYNDSIASMKRVKCSLQNSDEGGRVEGIGE